MNTQKKKNILVVTPYPLLPANSGGKIYALSTVKPLLGKYNFHLLALLNSDEREQMKKNHAEIMGKYGEVFSSVHFEDRPLVPYEIKNDRLKVLKHFVIHTLYGLPLMDISYYQPRAVKLAKSIISKYNVDIMEIHHLHMAFYKRFIPDVPSVLVNHNIESELWPFWQSQSNSFLAKKMWNFFGSISRRNAYDTELLNKYGFDAKFFISSLDMSKVPSGYCQNYLLPMNLTIDNLEKKFNLEKVILLWVGGFFWEPNKDGMKWFANEIWPTVKKSSSVPLELHIIGSDPPEELSKLHDGKEVFVHGFVDDVDSFRQKADIFVVPLRNGGGIRIKIVEALNAGIPVVSTSKGCEGLPVTNGENILVEDQPADFTSAVVNLINSIELRKRLSKNARSYCFEYHSPESVAKIKQSVYERIFQQNVYSR